MAIAFVNYSYAAPGGSGTTLDISAPANIVEGNLLVAGVSVSASGQTYTITPPNGWTSIASTYTGGILNTTKAELFYKIATSSEPATYQFSFDVTVSTRRAQISQFSGVDTSNPVDASGQTFSNTATSVDMPSLTVSTGAVYYAYVRTNQDTTHTYQSSMTGQQLSRHSFAYETITSGGSTGTRTCTFGASVGYGGIVFGIKPASSGTTYDESVTLTSAREFNDGTSISAFDVVGLQLFSLMGIQTTANLLTVLDFAKALGLAISEGSTNNYFENVALAVLFDTQSVFDIIKNAAVTLSLIQDVLVQNTIVMDREITLVNNLTIGQVVSKSAEVSLLLQKVGQMYSGESVQVIAELSIGELRGVVEQSGLSLEAALSIAVGLSALTSGFNPPRNVITPSTRTILVIGQDGRRITIESNNRRIIVSGGNREVRANG